MLFVNMTRVVSRATCHPMEPGQRLQQARKLAGLSRAQVAERSGYSLSGIGALENGQNNILPDAASKLAPIVNVSPEWLLYGREAAKPPGRRLVPVVGYVGAGSAAHYYATADERGEMVEAPDGSSAATVAAEIRGVSLGPALDGWLVFYDDARSPVTPDLFGQLCVVGLPDDRILVKVLRYTGRPNHFHLLSNGVEEPIFDQQVLWAAKVTGMKPR